MNPTIAAIPAKPKPARDILALEDAAPLDDDDAVVAAAPAAEPV